MRLAILAAAIASAALAGCVSMSRSSVVAPLSVDWAREGRIAEVRLDRNADLKVTPAFDDLFKNRVQSKLTACARGSRLLRLEARLDRFDKANKMMTTVVAGANVLRGHARIVDATTGQVVGDYVVGRTIVGGRLAIITMGQAEEQMSDAFGDELCKQAFSPRVARN